MAEAEKEYDDRIVVVGTSTAPESYTLTTGKTYTAAVYEGNGGAVYAEYATVTGENVTFQDNCLSISEGYGGAIYNGTGAVLNLTSSTFADNRTAASTAGTKGHGGAIYNSGEAVLSDATVSGNHAVMGGAIFNSGGTLELTGGTFSSNGAKFGGAIQNHGSCTVTVTDVTFTGNTAGEYGGAIAHTGGSMTITGSTFNGNIASAKTSNATGGAIYNGSKLTIANTTFSGNTAQTGGGAIYNKGTVNLTGTVTLATASDDFYNTGTLNWDLTGGTESYGSLVGYQYLNNVIDTTNSVAGTLTITVSSTREFGEYIIATGDLSNLDNKSSFTITDGSGEGTLTINGDSVICSSRKYTLATNDNGTTDDLTDDKLVLTVEPSGDGGEGGGGEEGGEEGGGAGGGEGGEGGGSGKTRPDKPDTKESPTLTGKYQLDSGTETLNGGTDGATLESTTADENVILVQNGASLTVSKYTLNKSGDTSDEDDSNFFAVNAVVAAKTAAKIYIDQSTINSSAKGANCLFASGEGSTIYAYDCTITSDEDHSRGLDATYEGTVIASKLTITTKGDHCASLATDKGKGYISLTDATLSTAGQGSALIYSTGVIEVDGVTGVATGAQIAGIEGLSIIRIKNSDLTGSGKKASEPVANGVIIYQSNSGDSTEGTATFEVSDSTFKSEINGGALFYITNSAAVITVKNTTLDFDSDSNYLLKAAGNDSHGWGTAGENGADVVFTAIDQKMSGDISVDGISSLDLYLISSTYTGAFENDTTYTGDGEGIDLFVDSNSTWTVTESCTMQNLTVASGAKIVDGDGKTVSIVDTTGTTKYVSGTSDLTITVSSYASGSVEAVHTITDFEIDRTAFETMYKDEESTDTPVITSNSTAGNVTAIGWTTTSESGTVDIAISAADSSSEKLLVQTDDKAIELYSVPEDCQLSLKDSDGSTWTEEIQVPGTADEAATAIVSNEDATAELFFAHASGTWDSQYQAQHVGSLADDWNGTGEYVELDGKNRIADTFTGSSDANILLLTDDANGDSLFVDDIYTAFPDEQQSQSRIAKIDEIRAGAGDDIVDMTSQSFEYAGDGLTVRGGLGDDTIWVNKGSNLVFGDGGNDRLVGASGDDVLVGGADDDSMHGGGGSDVFCFCDDWGTDTVEQLSDGSVTLWFASGSEGNWDQASMTYTDGDNSVTVTGVSDVTLKFGDDGTDRYDSLAAAGCFMGESSDKIFGTEQNGVLASV